MEKIRKHPCDHYRDHTGFYPLVDEDVWLCIIGKSGVKNYYCKKCHEQKAWIKKIRKEEDKISLKQQIKLRHKICIQELPDSYVIKRIKFANKALKDIDIDPELIELARVSLRLKYLIERKHKSLVNCVTHGNLYRYEIIKAGKDNYGDQRYKCKLCMKRFHKENYIKNKSKILARCKTCKKNNPEKVKEIKAKSRRKCNGKNNKHDDVTRQSITGNR